MIIYFERCARFLSKPYASHVNEHRSPRPMTIEYESEWNASYVRKENTLFYPGEPVVRFVNKFIRRRIGPDEFDRAFDTAPRFLDIGSGAGRHLLFLVENGYYPIGVELSEVACAQARDLMTAAGIDSRRYEIIHTTSGKISLPATSIDFAMSAATFDSMPTAVAIETAAQVFRVLKPGGLFYVDAISMDTIRDGNLVSSSDVVVSEAHEYGTVQSHYDPSKLVEVFGDFDVVEQYKTVSTLIDGNAISARWHLVLRKP